MQCAISADLKRYYAQQERAQREDEDRSDAIAECARSLLEETPYEVFISCEGLDAVEAINLLAKAKTGLELFEAQQALIECIKEQAQHIAKGLVK